MRLRAQVMLVGLATLAVPVLGWQSVRQLHVSLQQTRIDAQTLAVANLRVALAEADVLTGQLEIGALPANDADWYAETARWPLFVDGYADDWQELTGAPVRLVDGVGTDATLALRAARRTGRLFLFVTVRDARVVHHVPPRLAVDVGENERPDPETLVANGDALELYVRTPDGTTTHALLSAIAPGPVTVVRVRGAGARRSEGANGSAGGATSGRAGDEQLVDWRAEWVDDARGYQVEIELPLPPAGTAVGIAAIDVEHGGAPRDAWVGSTSPRAMRAGGPVVARLYHESPAVRALLAPWVPSGTRARLYDAAGRLVADIDALYAPLPDGDEPPRGVAASLVDAVLFRLFSWFAAGDLPLFPETEKTRQPLHLDSVRRAALSADQPTARYVTVDNDRVLGTLVALGDGGTDGDLGGASPGGRAGSTPRGYLLFESNEEHASRFTSSRLARLFAVLLLASLGVGTLLFGWATRLSLRIGRLSRDASRAVDADGRVRALAGTDARDELGELSRDLSALLARSSAYTRYLESLSARLSHELGTPLSVVRTSLENIDSARLDAESATLIARAGGGAERLGGIVRALIDSTRLEQSVQHATFAPLELRAWLGEAVAQYAQVCPEHRVRVAAGASSQVVVRAAASLLQQALDKLVANARDFATTPDIGLVLDVVGTGATARAIVAVTNRGPAIGVANRTRLFEPTYTSRAGEAEADGEATHGGFGLHVVQLVAEAHGGEAFARDVDGGVLVGLALPLDAGAVSA